MAHNMAITPEKFTVKTNHIYPPHNNMIFEDYFYNSFKLLSIETNRIYLPVLWTNYYLEKGNGEGDMSELQNFLDSLDRTKKYFTIVQYDDGILQNLKDLDILIFGSGGGGKRNVPEENLGYPIPLLCMSNPNINKNRERNILASFIGALYGRHKIREDMARYLTTKKGFIINQSSSYDRFKDLMETSVFSLCPRGYGATSFRICETLQYGSIPVYIYDNPWIPWKDEIDFNEYGVLISENQIKDIPEILKDVDVEKLRKNGAEIYEHYYSYVGCFNKIIEKII